DALDRPVAARLEALERHRQVSSSLRAGDRVHLVQDHGLDAAQHLARLRGQEQEERLRRRDENVGGRAEHASALVGRRGAGADRDGELRPETRERGAQIALDVVVQRFERRYVEETESLSRGRVETINPEQERCERLPGARGSLDENVTATRNRRPPTGLR